MTKSGNKIIIYSVYVLPLVLAIAIVILFIEKNEELTQLKSEYDTTVETCNQEMSKLQEQIKELNKLVQNGNQGMLFNSKLSDWAIESFRAKGLSDPVNDIISDLTKHPELIPYKGILGGTMRFYDTESRVLNNKWVYAYFEDGHYSGYMLLEYTVSDKGKISWENIAAMKN